MKTIVAGMSGGVDSSVAAWLLKQQGYDVVGLFMHNWEEEEGGHCTAESDFEDVKRVCAKIGIPYYTVNFSKHYLDRVFAHFLSEYAAGRTPNPDVLCNREIKFGPFLDFALKMGADGVATGHYAGIREADGRYILTRAADGAKDQSYFLHQLSQQQLQYAAFPLAAMQKPEVRAIARREGLPTAEKKDSTGICFIGERRFRDFLKQYLPAKEGDIVDDAGNTVGRHAGAMYYTLGQRKGLGLGGRAGGAGRWFVYKKDVRRNILYVSQGSEERLFANKLTAGKVNWICPPSGDSAFTVSAKCRYRQPDQSALAEADGNAFTLRFDKPQRALTPGQYAVLYQGNDCLGGGVIETVDEPPMS